MNKYLEFRKILNACSFGVLILLAIALLVHRLNVLPANINSIIEAGAAIVGYAVCAINGALFAITKGKMWIWITYAIAMLLVLILAFLNISSPVVVK